MEHRYNVVDFMGNVQKTNTCWLWLGRFRNEDGYGGFSYQGKNMSAHRVAWLKYCGKIPSGKMVLHKCDTPACVNPEHLYLGNNSDNMQDKLKRGRANLPHGEKHWKAKLNTSDVLKIKEIYATNKYTLKKVGKMYGVDASNISCIIRGITWRHV